MTVPVRIPAPALWSQTAAKAETGLEELLDACNTSFPFTSPPQLVITASFPLLWPKSLRSVMADPSFSHTLSSPGTLVASVVTTDPSAEHPVQATVLSPLSHHQRSPNRTLLPPCLSFSLFSVQWPEDTFQRQT